MSATTALVPHSALTPTSLDYQALSLPARRLVFSCALLPRRLFSKTNASPPTKARTPRVTMAPMTPATAFDIPAPPPIPVPLAAAPLLYAAQKLTVAWHSEHHCSTDV